MVLLQLHSFTEEEYDTYVTDFITDYFDDTVSDSYITSEYGLTLSRNTDLATMSNVQIVDTYIDRFSYTYPKYYVVLSYEKDGTHYVKTHEINMIGTTSTLVLQTDLDSLS